MNRAGAEIRWLTRRVFVRRAEVRSQVRSIGDGDDGVDAHGNPAEGCVGQPAG